MISSIQSRLVGIGLLSVIFSLAACSADEPVEQVEAPSPEPAVEQVAEEAVEAEFEPTEEDVFNSATMRIIADDKDGFNGDILLGRPTDNSVSISVLSATDQLVAIEYGPQGETLDQSVEAASLTAEEPYIFEIEGLEANTEYAYRIQYGADESSMSASPEYSFDTQRASGESFKFAVQADPHMGAMTRQQKWCRSCGREKASNHVFATTQKNTAAAGVDFLIDLGDTFMSNQNVGNGLYAIQEQTPGAPVTEAEVASDYRYLRSLFGQVGESVPVFLVPGNHDTETQVRLDGTPNNRAVWANNSRKKYFPTPTDGDFYSGSTTEWDHIGRHDGYYSWEWGDALFVALDPFWWQPALEGPWDRTLGEEQYLWLQETLEASDATFKFVFLHHLIGGVDNAYGGARGGHIFAEYFEWGGRTPHDYEDWFNIERDPAGPGTPGTFTPRPRVDPETELMEFETYRPGWGGKPIQQLLEENGVTIVFHGHDHVYAKEIHRSGIVYQTVPKPSNPRGLSDYVIMAARSGYDMENGVVIENSGFVQVEVSPEEVTVSYLRSNEGDCAPDCGAELADSYTIPAGGYPRSD